MITCQQCRDDMAEYALGHADPGVAGAMREHVQACVVCRRELAEIELAWSALPLALEPQAPRPHVYDRVLEHIDAASAAPLRQRQQAPPTPPLTPSQRLVSYVLAASVLAALVAGALYLRGPRPDAVPTDPAELALHDLAERLGKLQEIEQMLNSDNVRLASLYPPNAHDHAGAYVLWDLPAGQWHFFAPGLPPAPAGRAYQLWAVSGDAPPLAGPTFTVDAAGLGSVVADFPTLQPGAPAKAVVTLEPAAGSATPTGDVVLEAPL